MMEYFYQILTPDIIILGIIESNDVHPLLEVERDARTDDLFAFLEGPWILLCS